MEQLYFHARNLFLMDQIMDRQYLKWILNYILLDEFMCLLMQKLCLHIANVHKLQLN